ncbi:unnamed protein product [Rotaria magnacalcarata]|uniref:4-alpha-glucanotransferase n=5 Tax=Rotaria magnacalcarata TaxID=392030 RepID=A0A816Y0C1_9BILA|nr:unnamed protein product [Rotaria magnacalcarata]CAF3882134.1 unnamed protein product [Rotaria magnacalcarata]
MCSVHDEQVRILILNENEDNNEELFRLKTGWTLQIVLSAGLSARKIRIFSNACLNENDQFQRNNYQELKWVYPSNTKYDDSNRYVSILCCKSGSFHYYFTIDGTTSKDNLNGQGYFQVESYFIWPDGSGEVLEQDCITCQSVLSKSLGSLSEWKSRLEVTHHSGYNMIHFTPVQILNRISNSSYSISDHHKLNPLFQGTYEELKLLIDNMAKQWRILSITDLVYNHAASDCELLKQHPEAAYNLINSPHLKPAVLLDSILMQFTSDISEGKLFPKGIPAEIKEHHLSIIHNYLLDEKLVEYRFWEYYVCNTNLLVEQFNRQLTLLNDCPDKPLYDNDNLIEINHGQYQRMKSFIDLDLAEKIYFYKREYLSTKQEWINEACNQLRNRLNYLNTIVCQKLNGNLTRAVDNCIASCRYHFFSYDGPKYKILSLPSTPFVGNYFYYPNEEFKHPDEINQLIENDLHYQSFVMAHNGWIINDDPLRNFADEGHESYLRRDILQWSDLIKLRFGTKYEDCPSLYNYMKEYTRLVATTFHGCRLDNCHSTPLWFAQEMMDYAREINPNFYINAELSTGNIKSDVRFINQIGINSILKESHRAFDPYELGQMISFVSESDPIGSFNKSRICKLLSTKPYAWFYDQTHDNPCQIERRSVEDSITRSACVTMANCSTGSNRGYDELIPHHIDVVHETRFYSKWGYQNKQINEKTAIISIKKSLNKLHMDLFQQGFTQLMVDQLSTSALLITRHNPETHKSVLLISHTSFFQPSGKWEYINSLSIEGVIDDIILEASINHPQEKEPVRNFQRSKEYINGLEQTKIYFRENVLIEQSRCIRLKSPNSPDYIGFRTIEFTNEFRPGSIIALQISLLPQIRQSIINIKQTIKQFSNPTSQFNKIVKNLTLIDLERVLYRTSDEEQSDGKGFDVYIIPDYGKLNYCGLQAIITILDQIRLFNQLKHPLVLNLKQGNWLMNYIANRLKIYSNTKQLGEWYDNVFRYINSLSRLMVPIYFDLIIRNSYELLLEHGSSLMSSFIRQSSIFIRSLAQTSIQLISITPNSRLPLLSPNLCEPRPFTEKNEQTFEIIQQIPSLATGFPYFASDIWRNSSRNTFTSLRGLLLLTGRYEEARYLVLSYGGCLRHGLIPNLLADGKISRYNSRDSVWWWLYSISNYTNIVPDGYKILSDKVSRLYPTHDSPIQPVGSHDQFLYDVIHEVLRCHIQLLSFRERGAGHSLDPNMNDEGFNNQIGVDSKTGFVFGGNRWNCGTWMDKMGSSEKASNKGHPATPRDGSAIELIALCRTTISWLIHMNKENHYPYDSVETSSGTSGKTKLLLTDWLNRIDENFEKEFWIDESNTSGFVNRRQIYKDTINSTLQWTDYQLRPNFLIAAVIAPEMFNKTNIWLALKQVETILLGKYGIKTLDPRDYNYVGDYVNDDDSHDYKRAHGFNYHNGPEWLWLTGYYLRAKLYWSKQQNDSITLKETVKHIRKIISLHMDLLNLNDWKGLPELTNVDGQSCSYACYIQSCSCATFLEVLYDLSKI